MKTIAFIGLPNVGKSSLFNRIAKKRIAITSDFSGTTRDVRDHEVLIGEKPCTILDTGGLDSSNELFENVREKSMEAAVRADIIIMMVDGKMLPSEEERKIFYSLQGYKKPIALVINKIDNDKEIERAWEFDEFGAQNVFPISVSHNRGVTALLNWIDGFLPELEENLELEIEEDDDENIDLESILAHDIDEKIEEEESNQINIGIIGRTNVGKSSLLNALVGEERAVVSSVAGTTIDPVDEYIDYEDKRLNFVDTAGLRRRGKIEGIEKFALMRTNEMLEGADIALLVLDGSEPFRELDERIANLADKNNLATIIVLNKWDKKCESYEKTLDELRYRFKFLAYAPVITVSALNKKRVYKIKDLILEVYKNYSQRISTSKLNEVFKEATIRHHMPADQTKEVKIYFATQYDVKPPRIVLVMNRPKALHFSYKRYLMNKLREKFELEGSPILLYARKKGERDESLDI
ncbi:ribosome biogenesis GTPase Der [Sulfurospirillum arcachonense]|uniref:ribosome biogenesis GTPase Der n=1 Tax=Sulfurospirillum arcachonense TaxID=57666 RepID=UPI0004693711|nr:ribosome biogenesis GTPase Der [Sulfurospirillum arcachonense]